MTKYTNWKGEDIDISTLADDRLVVLYRFFLGYCKHLRDDKHRQEMESIKDALKGLIKERGLKMKNYT
jgi:hypothetical protein